MAQNWKLVTTLAPAAVASLDGLGPTVVRNRRVRRRTTLPGGRAVVGGLLVAASAVGVFSAYGASTAAPSDRYVVLARDLVPGELIEPDALAMVAIDLPADQRRVSFTDPGILAGTVALAAMKRGQLVQSSDVTQIDGHGDRAELSVSVEPGNAMNGDHRYLRGGERVDVVVTFESAGSTTTRTVARDAVVVEVLSGDDRLGSVGRLTVVLSLPPADVEAVAGAAASGTVTLVRTTGLRR